MYSFTYSVDFPIAMRRRWWHDAALYEYLTKEFWLLGAFLALNAYWTKRQIELFFASKQRDEAPNIPPTPTTPTTPTTVTYEPTTPTSFATPSFVSASPSASSVLTIPSVTTSPIIPSPATTARFLASPVDSSTTPAPPAERELFWLQPHITSRSRQILALAICTLVVPLQLLEGYWVIKAAWRITAAIAREAEPLKKHWVWTFALYLPIVLLLLTGWFIVLWIGGFLLLSQCIYILQLSEMWPPTQDPGELEGAKVKKFQTGSWYQLVDADSVQGDEWGSFSEKSVSDASPKVNGRLHKPARSETQTTSKPEPRW